MHREILMMQLAVVIFLAMVPFVYSSIPPGGSSEETGDYRDDGVLVAYSHRFIRYSADYEIILHSLQQHHGANVTATLSAADRTVHRQETMVAAGQQGKVIFKIGSTPLVQPIVLNVEVQYDNGISEKKSKMLELYSDVLVLIQLDKPMYKATESVKYRVLILNTNELTLSSNVKKIDVYLKNPAGDAMQERKYQQWSDDKHPGFFEGSFNPFSFEPEIGNWTVEVVAGSQIQRKKLIVADYYLPRYSVYINAPAYVVKGQPDFQFTVSLRDQTGNPAYGTVMVTVDNSATGNRELQSQAAKGQPVPFRYEFPRSSHGVMCSASNAQSRTITVKVRAVEKVTNREESAEVKIPFHCDPFKLHIQMKYNAPKPGIAIVVIHALNHDGSPYRHPLALQQAAISAIERNYETDITTTTVLSNGKMVDVEKGMITVPMRTDWHDQNASPSVNVTVGSVSQSKRIQNRGNTAWLRIQLLEPRTFRAGETVKFVMKCEPGCTSISYVIISPKGLLLTGTEVIHRQARQSRPLSVIVPHDTRTGLKIIAFSANITAGDLDLVIDSVDVKVTSPQEIQNITMELRPENRRDYVLPGRKERAQITVTAAAKSLVGLLAVDKNLLRLATGNDITHTDVLSQSARFSRPTQPEFEFDDDYGYCYKDHLMYSCGLTGLRSSFEESNVVAFVFESAFFMMNSPGGVGVHFDEMSKATESEVLRQDFRDSFLFITKTADAYGQAQFTELVPDSITTWAVTAFAAHTHKPLGLTAAPSELRVYQDWYIHVEVPNTLLEYEKASIDITVYNFKAHSPDAGALLSIECTKVAGNIRNSTQFHVKAREPVQQFSYPVGPYKKGDLLVTASLTHPKLGMIDRVRKSIPIYPGGVVVVKTAEPVAINAGNTVIKVDPKALMQEANIVPDSLSVSLNIFGDIWAPILKKMSMTDFVQEFNGLVRLPHGCGEQNMALLMPNVMLARYLKIFSAKMIPSFTLKQLTENMEEGFKRQFYYRLTDGSYNTFGQRDQPGSTWLTAFVVRGLSMAKEFIAIDDSQIEKSVKFLDSKQNPDGSFREDGYILDSGLLGGSGTGPALTAFVTLAYSQNHYINHPAMRKAKFYLEGVLPKVTDSYSLAITCFALSQLESQVQGLCTAMLDNWAITDQPDKRYWLAARKYDHVGNRFTARDVETTAYALLALIHLHEHSEHDVDDLRIVNWLLAQRNANGGFISTQDTVVALNALNDVSVGTRNSKQMSGRIFAGKVSLGNFTVPQHSLRIKNIAIPSGQDVITVVANGGGRLRGQLEYKYRTIPPRSHPATARPAKMSSNGGNPAESEIELKVRLRRIGSNNDRLSLSICPKYSGRVESGMVVIEATALTGYQFDAGNAKTLEKDKRLGVDKADCVDNKARMEIYLREILQDEPCIDLDLYKYLTVENVAPRSVKVYRYYEPSVSQAIEYSLADLAG
ncbi:pregnancy zone protein-like [Paramacrobiotus metropolitanus]|uniref:pregnancy zone protein-like n=1 Tax=Paramacrobiotus metropolitanus TaxID=2943436 RepID=UPI00244575E8|nr:pregnancy zone protein-like [Paramacrobiotus metropolitanus]